jgi:hypothetical protein
MSEGASLYGEFQSQNTALSGPLSSTLSSLFLSLALRKCQVLLQNVKLGNSIDDLKICSLALVGISFCNLIRTPILLLVFCTEMVDMCLEKLSP